MLQSKTMSYETRTEEADQENSLQVWEKFFGNICCCNNLNGSRPRILSYVEDHLVFVD